MIFLLCFRDIMVGTHHNPEGGSANDEEIRRIIHEEVAATIREAIPEMFGPIKTTQIETFNERYAAVTKVDAAASTAAVAVAKP